MKHYRTLLLTVALTLSLSLFHFIIVSAKNSSAVPQAPTATMWIDTVRHNGVIYFLFNDPIKLERYDVTNELWLDPITFDALLEAPTAVVVDESHIFVAFGQAVYRFNLDGTGQLHLHNTSTAVRDLFTNSLYLIINYSSGSSGRLATLEKESGLFVDSASYTYDSLNGPSYSAELGKIFGRTSGISPSDIIYVAVNSDGTLGASAIDSPYHGSYPNATGTFLFPGDGRVVDTAGIVYNTSDLSYSNSLAGAVNDIGFYGDLPIVRRGGTLIAFSNTLLQTGSYTPTDHTPAKIYVEGDTILSFYFEETRGVAVTAIDVALLSPDVPGEAVDPNGLKYVANSVALGNDEIIYILSKSQLSIFRWSVATRSYLETIPLAAAPTYMAYSPVTNRIYLAYASGEMTQIKLDDSFAEVPFANLPGGPLGLATAGEYVFAVDASGSWESHYTFHPDGTQISAVDWNYRSNEYFWSEANRKMYFFREGVSPNDLLWENIAPDGTIGTKLDSPYHSSDGIVYPINVAPDGSKVILGSGRMYDAISLVYSTSLPNTIKDAAWISSTLYTLQDIGVDIQVQRWGPTYGLEAVSTTPGEAIQLYAVDEGLLAIINFYGLPRFILYDADFNVLFESETMLGLEAFNNSPTWLGNATTLTSTLAFGAGNINYTWQFGDGASQSGKDVSHNYSALGEFEAVLTASNEAETISTTTAVAIIDYPVSGLVAANNGPTQETKSTQLTATVAHGTNVTYAWNLGDGTLGSGTTVNHVYPAMGTYTATVTATNSTNHQVATTQVVITELVTPLIGLAPDSLSFTVNAGNESPETQLLTITNVGTGSLNWQLSEGLSWLSLGQLSGTAPGSVVVSASWNGLPVGVYTGQITVSSASAANSPQFVPVTLHVLPEVLIDLSVESGYTAVALNWSIVADPDLAGYAIFRTAEGTQNWVEIDRTTAHHYFDDSPELVPGQSYCYFVAAFDDQERQLAESAVQCTVFGGTTLWVPDVMAAPGTTAVVPVNISNAQGLRIAAADIWMEYDSSVLTFQSVSSTPLTAGYIWSFEDEAVSGSIRRVKIGTFSLVPPALFGEGSLFWLHFQVIGTPLATSDLNLKEFIYGVGGSTIYTPDNLITPISLILTDGLFTVEDGFALGDLNGNGVVETVDAYIALQIVVKKIIPSSEQLNAGDINGNGRIDVADATMIFYYAVHGEWPQLHQTGSRVLTPAAPVTLSLGDVTAEAGQTASIQLHAENLADWAGGQFAIVYDPAVVERIVAVNGVALAKNFLVEMNDNGTGLAQIAMIANTAVSGSGDILNIEVQLKPGLAPGDTGSLTIGAVELNDLVGRDFTTSALQLEIITFGGSVKVGGFTIFLPMITRP
ncbi:MAG: PKD domain-containing protein [Anaerolineaceae bacterium]|nr:PKD domain-containing protein [Anaerolineaceae bacterium]